VREARETQSNFRGEIEKQKKGPLGVKVQHSFPEKPDRRKRKENIRETQEKEWSQKHRKKEGGGGGKGGPSILGHKRTLRGKREKTRRKRIRKAR